MRGLGIVPLALLLAVTGGCTHVTADTSQFYLAQTYLPLPPAARDSSADMTGASGCVAGPVKARPRAPGERYVTQLLPGMTLHVTQTSYAATRSDEAAPLISEWRWTLPTAAVALPKDACADDAGAVPAWTRQDLLRVRHLLSGAQLMRGNPPPGQALPEMPPSYFAEAMRDACGTAPGAGLKCAEGPFLDKFVAGLELNVRAQGRPWVGQPVDTKPGQKFDPTVPPAVLADSRAPAVGTTGYGQWYASLSGFRYPADMFAGGLQADRCGGPFSNDLKKTGTNQADPGELESPLAQDAPVCQFSQTSLEWSAQAQAQRLPGTTLKTIDRLSLLRSGDPLFLFQPRNYVDPLDLGNAKRCNDDPRCVLADRTMQGFADIELLIPVTLDNGERRWVPVGMSVAAYENANGVVVDRISRSVAWLPDILQFEDRKDRPASRLADPRGRIDLRFIASGKKPGMGGGIAIRNNPGVPGGKADILFAPGDIITARRP